MQPPPLLRFAPADALNALRGRWPPSLVDDAGLRAAVDFAAGLPALFNWMILEARSSGPGPVDFLAAILDVDGERDALAEIVDDPSHAALASSWPLLRAWSRREAPDLDPLRVLWWEWDAPFRRPPLVLPCIDPRFWGPPGPPPSPESQVALAAAVHRGLYGELPPATTRDRLRRAIAALPPAGRALSTASLRPRGIAHDRLFVGIPRDQVVAWLAAIEWPGDRQRVAELLPRLLYPWEEGFLQIEVASGITPYLGIEPRQHGASPVELELRRGCLAGLAADGVVPEAFVDAVIGWSGDTPRGDGAIERRNFHLKHVLHPGGELEVKAYLGVYFVPE